MRDVKGFPNSFLIALTIEDASTGLTDGAVYSDSNVFVQDTEYYFDTSSKADAILAVQNGVGDVQIIARDIRGSRTNKAIKLTFTFSASRDGRYAAGAAPVVTYWRSR